MARRGMSASIASPRQRLRGFFSNPSPFVFVRSRSERLLGFEPAVESAEIPDFTWHCLRHTFASRLTMKGVDPRSVQSAMGNRTIRMTRRYAHLAPSTNSPQSKGSARLKVRGRALPRGKAPELTLHQLVQLRDLSVLLTEFCRMFPVLLSRARSSAVRAVDS
jgi:Phage integrase family